MSGATATALPAERRNGGIHEIDRADLCCKIVGDADGNTGAALVHGDQARRYRTRVASSCRQQRPATLGIKAFHDLAEKLVTVHVLRRGRFSLGSAAAHGERLFRLSKLALETAAFLHQAP